MCLRHGEPVAAAAHDRYFLNSAPRRARARWAKAHPARRGLPGTRSLARGAVAVLPDDLVRPRVETRTRRSASSVAKMLPSANGSASGGRLSWAAPVRRYIHKTLPLPLNTTICASVLGAAVGRRPSGRIIASSGLDIFPPQIQPASKSHIGRRYGGWRCR
jgi:hypothetical protein